MSLVSDVSPETETTLNVSEWWLKDVFDPSQNRIISPEGDEVDVEMRQDMSVFNPIGRTYPVVVKGVVRSERFSLSIGTITPEEGKDIDELWAENRTVLVQSPMAERGDQWYAELREASRRILNTNDPWQVYEVAFVEVERPEDDE